MEQAAARRQQAMGWLTQRLSGWCIGSDVQMVYVPTCGGGREDGHKAVAAVPGCAESCSSEQAVGDKGRWALMRGAV